MEENGNTSGAEEQPVSRVGHRLMVLAVDDDPVTLELIVDSLSHACIVLTAQDAHEGIELAKHHKPDIILLDIMMPMIDGLDALMLIKADDEIDKIPTVMVSALRKKSKIVQSFREGAADYLLKPFNADMLIKKIQKVLGDAAAGLSVDE